MPDRFTTDARALVNQLNAQRHAEDRLGSTERAETFGVKSQDLRQQLANQYRELRAKLEAQRQKMAAMRADIERQNARLQAEQQQLSTRGGGPQQGLRAQHRELNVEVDRLGLEAQRAQLNQQQQQLRAEAGQQLAAALAAAESARRAMQQAQTDQQRQVAQLRHQLASEQAAQVKQMLATLPPSAGVEDVRNPQALQTRDLDHVLGGGAQQVHLPAGRDGAEAPVVTAIHRAAPGETLTGIAGSRGIELPQLQRLNPQITSAEAPLLDQQAVNLPGGAAGRAFVEPSEPAPGPHLPPDLFKPGFNGNLRGLSTEELRRAVEQAQANDPSTDDMIRGLFDQMTFDGGGARQTADFLIHAMRNTVIGLPGGEWRTLWSLIDVDRLLEFRGNKGGFLPGSGGADSFRFLAYLNPEGLETMKTATHAIFTQEGRISEVHGLHEASSSLHKHGDPDRSWKTEHEDLNIQLTFNSRTGAFDFDIDFREGLSHLLVGNSNPLEFDQMMEFVNAFGWPSWLVGEVERGPEMPSEDADDGVTTTPGDVIYVDPTPDGS